MSIFLETDVVVRKYKAGDETEIVPLLKIGFKEWQQRGEKAIDYWRWMYMDHPLKSPIIFVGVSEDDLIATNHTISVNVKIRDKIVKCSYGSDVMVHPDYRNRGIYSRIRDQSIVEEKKSGNIYAYLYTTNPIVIKNYKKNPADNSSILFPYDIKRYLRIKDVNLHLQNNPSNKAWILGLGYRALSLAGRIKGKVFEDGRLPYTDVLIRHADGFDQSIEEFWRKVSDYYSFIIVRNREFLEWRYCDSRIGPYEIILAEDDSGVLGYVVLYIMEKIVGYPVGYIVDLLTIPERLDVSDLLVNEAVKYFDFLNINSVNSLVMGHSPLEAVFQKYGFVDSRRVINIFFLSFTGENDIKYLDFVSAEKIHFSHSDMFLF